MEQQEGRERGVVGRRGARAPLFPLLIDSWGAKPRGQTWGFTAPTTPTIHDKVTPWESQQSTGAAADPLGCRGAVVAGPAYGHVPSRA